MNLKKTLSFLLSIITIFSLTSCELDNRHIEGSYEEDNSNLIIGWDEVIGDDETWENISIRTFEDSDVVCSYVYDQILFDDITDQYASVAAIELDYKSNGEYFYPDKVYKLIGNKFDLNPLITKFAVGTGVILVCVVLNVVTAGVSSPIACFIAGAAQGAVSGAVQGAAMGAAMGAITSTIKSGGDWEKSLYGTVEGATDGYMWGSIFGAITGGLQSKYCFTADTLVKTPSGMIEISNIKEGDYVYSYNEIDNSYSYEKVVGLLHNSTYDTIKISTLDDTIESTLEHPYMTIDGWKKADSIKEGDYILTSNDTYEIVKNIEYIKYLNPIETFNLNIDNNHTYVVGNDELVVHNVCAKDYAGDTYHFPEGSPQAKKYPNGIRVDSKGYPRFEDYAIKSVKFDYPTLAGKQNGTCLTGYDYSDFKMCNKLAGFSKTPAGYTWHHVEDMQTMLLVPQDIHSFMFGGLRHSGGASLIRTLFNSLLVA